MTRKSKRTQLIFWLIIIGLLISMLIAFTPTLNGLFGGGQQAQQLGEPALVVNGETIYSLEVAQAQQQAPFNMGFEGEVGDDLNLLLADTLIQNRVLQQAASNIRVSDGEVRDRLNQFREEQNIAGARNDTAYLNLIGQYGFTDATFRDYWRDQIRFERYRENLTKDVTVTDAEVEAYYNLNQDAYKSEEKIRARQIVVSDQAKAEELLAQAQAGEDFATLARENSEELADRDGALGAASGSTDPQPVGAAALPGAVSQAAFALQGPGITDVINANEKFYIVSVEEFLPSANRPLEEVRDEVQTAALESKKQGVLETTFEDLRNNAQVSVSENSVIVYDNPAVAKVGETEIKKSELVGAVYNSQQIQQALQPGMEQIITGLFKPTYLEQLIDREVAYQGAQQIEGATFFGSKSQIAQQALQYVSRDASATPEELQAFYDENLESRFTIPASAVVNRVDFTTQEAATAFRTAMLEGGELQATAEANGGIVTDLGTVQAGSLPTELDTALFGTDAFDPLPESEETISDILVVQEPVEDPALEETTEETSTEETSAEEESTEEATEETTAEETLAEESAEETTTEATTEDGTTATATAETTEPATKDVYVVLVGTRTPEEVRPFEEVKAQVEEEVLNQKRSELQQTWLEEIKATIPVENFLAAATPPATEATPGFETTPLPTTEEATPAEDATTEETATETESTEATSEETTSTEETTPAEETPTTEESPANDAGAEARDAEPTATETPASSEEAPADITSTETTEESTATESETNEETPVETTETESSSTPESTSESATETDETTDSTTSEEVSETTEPTTEDATPSDEATPADNADTPDSSNTESEDTETSNSENTTGN
jgi:parvulin-like peptidyl-prolyl isomerase